MTIYGIYVAVMSCLVKVHASYNTHVYLYRYNYAEVVLAGDIRLKQHGYS